MSSQMNAAAGYKIVFAGDSQVLVYNFVGAQWNEIEYLAPAAPNPGDHASFIETRNLVIDDNRAIVVRCYRGAYSCVGPQFAAGLNLDTLKWEWQATLDAGLGYSAIVAIGKRIFFLGDEPHKSILSLEVDKLNTGKIKNSIKEYKDPDGKYLTTDIWYPSGVEHTLLAVDDKIFLYAVEDSRNCIECNTSSTLISVSSETEEPKITDVKYLPKYRIFNQSALVTDGPDVYRIGGFYTGIQSTEQCYGGEVFHLRTGKVEEFNDLLFQGEKRHPTAFMVEGKMVIMGQRPRRSYEDASLGEYVNFAQISDKTSRTAADCKSGEVLRY